MIRQLNQSEWYSLRCLENNAAVIKSVPVSGVYVWGFSLEDQQYAAPSSPEKFFPFYVGRKIVKLYDRIFSHLCTLQGGGYPIFDVPYLLKHGLTIGKLRGDYECELKRARKRGQNHELPAGLLYYPEGCNVFHYFRKDIKVQETVQWMLDHFVFTFLYAEDHKQKLYLSHPNDYSSLESYVTEIFGADNLISEGAAIDPFFDVELKRGEERTELRCPADLFKLHRGAAAAANVGIL